MLSSSSARIFTDMGWIDHDFDSYCFLLFYYKYAECRSKNLTRSEKTLYNTFYATKHCSAGVAQLVERLTCNEDVAGSIPVSGSITRRVSPDGGIGRRARFRS